MLETNKLYSRAYKIRPKSFILATLVSAIGCNDQSAKKSINNSDAPPIINGKISNVAALQSVQPNKPEVIKPADTTIPDPIELLFGSAVRVADQTAKMATEGVEEKSLQKLIESTADGLRAGLNLADEGLPPLEPQFCRDIGDIFRYQVVSRKKLMKDQNLIKIVLPVWNEIVTASKQPLNSLTVTFVDDPTPNAYAFVGGNVVVNRGFIEFALRCDKTSEVIRFALAHELGHIVCGHTDTLLRRMVAAEKIIPGSGIGPEIIETIIKQTPINQSAEREADCFARRLHLANGWSLEGGKEFFIRVQRMKGRQSSASSIDSLFASHPDEARRIELLNTSSDCDVK